MSDTHGGTIALYERVSTIHYSHIVMVPLIISMCLSTHRNLLITRSCIHAGRLCVTSRSHGNRAFGSFASSLRSRLVALFFRSLFCFPLPRSPKDIVSSKHMCDTHGGTIASSAHCHGTVDYQHMPINAKKSAHRCASASM
jgi:hypothetical protein